MVLFVMVFVLKLSFFILKAKSPHRKEDTLTGEQLLTMAQKFMGTEKFMTCSKEFRNEMQ